MTVDLPGHKRIGIIHDTTRPGLGGHGTHLAFRGLPQAQVVALADSNLADIETRLRETGATKHYSDYRAMLDRERPDIVILTSRLPADHLPQIETAARLGIHVLCEKPMTADLEEADRIVNLAEKHRIKIAVAHLARYAPVFRTMKQMLEAGAIGRPLAFYGRGKEDERGGGEDMIVLGTHILDLGCFLFGDATSIFADITVEGRPLRRSDRSMTKEPVGPAAGDSIMAVCTFPNGVRGIFESRRGLLKSQARMGITVAGTEGMLSVRYDDRRKLRLSRSQYPPEDEAVYEELPVPEYNIPHSRPLITPANGPQPARYFEEGNRLAAWDLMCAIEADRPPAASAQNARFTLEMIYGIYASALQGRRITLPLQDRVHPLLREEIR